MKTIFLSLLIILCVKTSADFTKITNFNNPGTLNMYKYKPKGLNKTAPVVIVLHGCQQKAKDFAKASGWQSLADKNEFMLLLPEQTKANNFIGCFRWFDKENVTKGKGEVASIANAIDKLAQLEKVDLKKVFVTGLSAGASMASALMANYPEKINAGAIVAGVPYGCAFSMGQSFKCMLYPGKTSATTLGNDVRNATNNYKGHYPEVFVVHGGDDSIVSPKNANHSILQWTNVHGIDSKVDKKREISGTVYLIDQHIKNDRPIVQSLTIEGAGHGWPIAAKKGCGKAGKFLLDQSVCMAHEFIRTWGLSLPLK